LSALLEQGGDVLNQPSVCCQLASSEDTLAFYQKALEALQAAAVKEPDNQNLQSRKAALSAKIERLVGSRQNRPQ
jgi:hypothetical protein